MEQIRLSIPSLFSSPDARIQEYNNSNVPKPVGLLKCSIFSFKKEYRAGASALLDDTDGSVEHPRMIHSCRRSENPSGKYADDR